MLRLTGLSLLLGLAALVAILYIVYLPPGLEQPAASSLHWTPSPGAGPSSDSDPKSIVLDSAGEATLHFSQTPFDARHYAYLHIAIENLSSLNPPALTLQWESSRQPGTLRSYTLETTSYESLWLATQELRGWGETITSLRVSLTGSPEQSLQMSGFALRPSKLKHQLRAIQSDLTALVQWNRSSMNSHTGVRDTSSFYPTILFTAFWLASLGFYGLLSLAIRKIQFQWEVVGLVTLSAWIALDLTWQSQLVQQAATTRDNFAGKSSTEKLMVGPDAQLYAFIDALNERVTEKNARVFAASSDDYTGLRAAYYLYPHNAFWSLDGDEIPRRHFLRSGDYIALLNPNTSDQLLSQNLIALPDGDLAVETLLSTPGGTLVRVQ